MATRIDHYGNIVNVNNMGERMSSNSKEAAPVQERFAVGTIVSTIAAVVLLIVGVSHKGGLSHASGALKIALYATGFLPAVILIGGVTFLLAWILWWFATGKELV